jgi:hypothetical protein|tara:strand:+ start:122 stop:718 length:597 start_codon:yes stop_codon:yes gene_type:complete
MKFLKILFVLFVAVSLVSCSSDDDGVDPLLDTDGDGVVDIDDLCPNTTGTIIDQGCYLFTNINVSSSPYSVTMLNTTEIQTTNVNGLDIVTEKTRVGDIFQLTYTFSENGTFVLDGEYLVNYSVVVAGEIITEDTEIIVIDNGIGSYTTNDSTMILVFDDKIYSVTLFNQNDLRITTEDIYEENGDEFVYTSEIRMTR